MVVTRARLAYPKAEMYLGMGEKADRRWDGKLASKRVFFVDNGRPNADRVLALVEQELRRQFGIESHWVRKAEHVTPGMGPATMVPVTRLSPGIEREAQVVVAGIGN